ncbi:MAG TPA: cytochrome c [Steroidobacteraceae bacterium]|jgi:mono/diheme cytochrome c family protein|nr:cytochrome c [Steroidobacteraceae bacterium]
MRVLIACVGLLASAAFAKDAPAPATSADGKALYHEKCAMCHDKTGMGTGLLARRSTTPELLQRIDLDAAFVVQAARAGIGNMPAIPRGEVSDRQLQAIAEYLAQPEKRR